MTSSFLSAKDVPSAATPRTDALLNELRQLRSHTLSYPCETQLTELGRTLERELTASNVLLDRMAVQLQHEYSLHDKTHDDTEAILDSYAEHALLRDGKRP